ncbi:hypothetical protein ABFS82_06G183400 [Erythranthe guttata]|uniref:NAC domain-containing protein n=1 Tax=Erythranthe guttata TaxID=4155 RepID=A0A022RHK0_ERYGU|nr:PREDICTED: NAC domain-containing protein 53-like [Erythranthe guttata]EYU39671.1 hypothetical protein MIMGU_mgv1a003896mg [Erythranthe guttata]|eukprot:XP_012834786.1 PREDICTED: NAC domain-containing protein 53-like [Erythranthe guttata]
MEMESNAGKKKSSGLLAPGFRFHPTDEELVRYYLRRKVCGRGFRFDAISEIDIYKAEPWDLPSFSKLRSRDLEWYFFSVLDKKYGNGSRTNRATEKGYWKTTGKDRAVYHRTQVVGMKKTLVYHSGRAPKGLRSNWVMHEYRLIDMELEKAGIVQDAFVLCRVFQKSGSGPKNGEQYGAPFMEEEWEDEEWAPKSESAEEVDFGDDIYLDGHDLEQILGSDIAYDVSPLPLTINSADGSFVEDSAESPNDAPMPVSIAGEQYYEQEQLEDKYLCDLPVPYDMEVRAVKHEYIGESSKSGISDEFDYLLDEPLRDSSADLQYGNGSYIEADEGHIETNDLSNPVETNNSPFDMEEYLSFFDANNDNSDHFMFDSSMILENEDLVSDQTLLLQEELDNGTEQCNLPSEQLDNNNNDNSSASSSDNLDSAKYESDYKYPFMKQASQMLGKIPAPPAFASEFPLKDAALRLNSLSQPSSSVHVTAGMIQITDGRGGDQLLGKHENFNIVLSFGFSANMDSSFSALPGKAASTVSRGWLYFMFLWVLILSVSFKIGICICAK